MGGPNPIGLICPYCYNRNREGANYCDACGKVLTLICDACKNRNRLGARFCDECGAQLQGEKQETFPTVQAVDNQDRVLLPGEENSPADSGFARLIPSELAKKIETARNQQAMAGERKVVTILFCDLAGSTAAASQMDPEVWGEIVDGALGAMIAPVYQYEGFVARLMGDAILAFFGAPIAHEDDPQRAILAAFEILKEMEKFRDRVKDRLSVPVEVRVGIHTGLVIVGKVGNNLQMEYTAIGDAINLAARMEQTARAGTIQVSEATYDQAAKEFEFEDLGEVEVKGKGSQHTYRPLRQKSRPETQREIMGFQPQLIGRQEQLVQMDETLQELKRGVGRIVWITGEAGIGKSRFIREIKDRVSQMGDEGQVYWHETSSYSYEAHKPYALFRRLFTQAWGIFPGDSSIEVQRKIETGLQGLGPGLPPEYQEIFERLIGAQDEHAVGQEGESFKNSLFSGVLEVGKRYAGLNPVVLVMDDLQWADPASIELLQELFLLPEKYPILILCAMRTDTESSAWAAGQMAGREFPHRFTRIDLQPLSDRESDQFVNELLSVADLPDVLQGRIRDITDGNPFFIEEVIRSLIDQEFVVQTLPGKQNELPEWRFVGKLEDLHIPESLQTLLTARIDRLDPSARKTLQAASVVGRTFYYKILDVINRSLHLTDSGLEREILILQRTDLIRETSRFPELEYIFRHSLTQEAAYGTLLLKQRREYHLRVGEAIEQIFADRLDEFFPILAHHFQMANDRRALKYETLSGDDAMRLNALSVAAEHYQKALGMVTAEKGDADVNTVSHLYSRLGRVYELEADYRKALEVYGEMEARAGVLGDDHLKLAALISKGTVLALPTPIQDSETALDLSKSALKLARMLGDRRMEAKVLWNFLLVHNYTGFMQQGIPFGEESVRIAREDKLNEQLAHSLQDLAHAYLGVERMGEARKVLAEALELWKEFGYVPMIVENLMRIVYERLVTGNFADGLAASEEALKLAEQIQNDWGKVNSQLFTNLIRIAMGDIGTAIRKLNWAIPIAEKVGHPAAILLPVHLSIAYENLGQFDRAFEYARKANARSTSFPPFRIIGLAQLVHMHLLKGEMQSAREHLETSFDLGKEGTFFFMNQTRFLSQIELFIANGELSKAEEHLDVLLRNILQTESRFLLPDLLWLNSRIAEGKGELDTAMDLLEQALYTAKDMGYNAITWKLLFELRRMAELHGDPVKAGKFADDARSVVRAIAAKIEEEELRSNFMEYAASYSGIIQNKSVRK